MQLAHGLLNSDVVAGTLHAVSAFALALAKDDAVDSTVQVGSSSVSPLAFAASAAFWSSLVHNATAVLDPSKQHNHAYMRYVDYTISASLMGVPAAVYSGQRDMFAIVCGVVTMACAMVVAGVCEALLVATQASKNDRAARLTIGACSAACIATGVAAIGTDSEVAFKVSAVTCVVVSAAAASVAAQSTRHAEVMTFVAGALLYVAAWTTLLADGDASEQGNGLVTRILVVTHALFVVLFLARTCGRFVGVNVLQNDASYDVASTTLSVFCKIVLHWLVFSTSPFDSANDSVTNVVAVVCMSLLVASLVLVAHLVGSGAWLCGTRATILEDPLVMM